MEERVSSVLAVLTPSHCLALHDFVVAHGLVKIDEANSTQRLRTQIPVHPKLPKVSIRTNL
jgi:hypothetical protein